MAAKQTGQQRTPTPDASPVRQPASSRSSVPPIKSSDSVPSPLAGNQAVQRLLQSLHSGGEPLDASLRSFYEPKFKHSLGEVRVHKNQHAADVASTLKARAFTIGNDIVFGSGEYDPSSAEGRSLIAHELTHIVQQLQTRSDQGITSSMSTPAHPAEKEAARGSRQVGLISPITAVPRSLIHRNGPEGEVSEPPVENTQTFVLDPALQDIAIPDHVTTHVKVQEPMAFSDQDTQLTDRYVELEQPIKSAKRICVFAVPVDQVFDKWVDAFTGPSVTPTMTRVPPDVGAQVWTIGGLLIVSSVRDNLVFTETPTHDAVGAGAVVLLESDSGPILLDAGLQLTSPEYATTIGKELTERVKLELAQKDISEAILLPKPPTSYALPHIASQIRLLSVRATRDQYDQGAVTEVLRAQNEYRQWYEASLRDSLTAKRTEWESTQPIAPNDSIREQRWTAHLEAEMASAIQNYTPRLLVAETSGPSGNLQLRNEEFLQGAPSDVGQVPDLSETQWAPADDQKIFIYGNGRLTMLPSIGILLKPTATPTTTVPEATVVAPPPPQSVSGIRPTGPLGMAPAVPRPVTPFLALATIGKEMHMVVRVSSGLAIMVDAGGPRVITMDAFAQLATSLGISSVERILVTHPHIDHVRNLLELIETHQIRPENLVVSRSWIDTGTGGTEQLIEKLRTTTKPELTTLGYGPPWTDPGVSVPSEGVTRLRITSGQSQIDVYARGAAHQEYQAQRRDVRQGRRKSMESSVADSASFVYVIGNESSPNRTAVLGDFRGEDLVEMQRSLGADQFKEAFKNVKVIKGIGHHFSETAGRTPTDIRGMNLLLDATLVQNGELTILVQSRAGFAFKGQPTLTGPEGALLNYFTQQGVRVVFSGESTAPRGPSGTALVSSDIQVTRQGTGILIFESQDQRVVEMHRRLEILRQARKTVIESPEFGPAALGLEQRKGPELQQALETEIRRLEDLARELRGRAAVELLRSRGAATSELTGPQRTERAAFEAESLVEGRTIDLIVTDMAQRGPVEGVLTPAVIDQLRGALSTGRSLGAEVELAATPRSVLDAIEQLPEARRKSLAKKYRELAELTNTLEADVIPDAQRLEILLRTIQLRNEVFLALQEAGSAKPPALESELTRLNSVVDQLKAHTESQDEITRDHEGRRTRTQYVRVQANDLIQKGFHGLGRGMGAVMVIHSVEELGTVARDIALGDTTLPEAMLRMSHAVYGMNIGVRMARTTYSQLLSGKGGQVKGWEFVIMAVIEVGAAATANYKTSEERNAAIVGTAVHSAVNLACMYIGQGIMNLSAKFLPHPLAKLAGMGLGLAIMMAGERIIKFLGLDDDIARWTQFPPGEVTDVNLKINSLLDDYRIMIGAQQFQARETADLGEVGIKNPLAAKTAAEKTEYSYGADAQSKEKELTTLFEKAYDRTRESYAGLQMLDQQAAEFLRLRGLAVHSEKFDVNREELDRRWRAMDQRLDLSGATAQKIKDMEQWKDIDKKLTELSKDILGTLPRVDMNNVFENLDKAQQMMENARYRLMPGKLGSYRTKPLIPEGTEAYRVYREMLLERETRFAGFHSYLMSLGHHAATEPIFKSNAIDPRSAFVRLRTIANNYDARLQATTQAFPELAKPETWATPAVFAKLVEDKNRNYPGWFVQLRTVERTLESAARQASSVTHLASPPPDPTLAKLIDAEIARAVKLMESRRTDYGLLFLNELDAMIETRSKEADRILATELRAAYPTEKMCKVGPAPPPLTESEVAAAQTSAFTKHGGETVTSEEKQLAELRRIIAPWRTHDPNIDPLRDWDKLSRVVDRPFMILPNPYEQWDPKAYIKNVDEYHYDPTMTPIVALLQLHMTSLAYGAFTEVLPINADAVKLMGTGTRQIRTKGGRIIKEAEILEEARKAQGL